MVVALGAAVGEEAFTGLVDASGDDVELLREGVAVGREQGFGAGENGVGAESVVELEEDAGRSDENVGTPGGSG